MTTISTWLEQNIRLLREAGISSARLDCLLLLEDEICKSREWVLAHNEHEITESHLLNLDKKVARRARRIPLAHVRNTQEFYGRSFYVDSSVLVPRPETESIINLLKSSGFDTSSTIIDVGTGSGCISITTKLEFPQTRVIATDLSEPALEVARTNARSLGVDITFLRSDLLSSLRNIPLGEPNVVLANLPYVPTSLVTSPEITNEPQLALFSGKDGLDLYRQFWGQVNSLRLKPRLIITESLKSQHNTLIQLASDTGYKLDESEVLCQRFIQSDQIA